MTVVISQQQAGREEGTFILDLRKYGFKKTIMVAAFPIAKLAALAMKQLSKPLSKRIKERAKNSLFFRTYICMPPAQLYHWCDIRFKMRLSNLGKPTEIPKLNEAMAIELGAELLGETIIFTVAALTILGEYLRQAHNERKREQAKTNSVEGLENSYDSLKQEMQRQASELRDLRRSVTALESKVQQYARAQFQEDLNMRKKQQKLEQKRQIEEHNQRIKPKPLPEPELPQTKGTLHSALDYARNVILG
ncbi:OPA3 [Cordylochernes scorpioides]|uniref:OPA3 n=1 Tax=Cordylochernes scorpioides TaxID=51811 RepID=A0ABY6L0G0_9ARAC|nr:OPA3 [Cordylochernes scorpioides]